MRIPATFVVLVLAAGTAAAQRAETTAASEADDAFGLSVAGETIGLYSDKFVRGFSPVDAGNLRLDGLYIDRQGEFSERLFSDVAIRVGLTALETPLPAPSGIADYSLRRPGDASLLSVATGLASFGSPFLDVDWSMGHRDGFALAAGASVYPDENEKGGGDGRYHTWFLSPTWINASGVRLTAYASHSRYEDYEGEIAYYTAGAFRPPEVRRGHYLGQDWAGDSGSDRNYGMIVDQAEIAGWALKAGVFRSEWRGDREVFQYVDAIMTDGSGVFGTILIPDRTYVSWSGEVQASRDLTLSPDWTANVLVNLRARDAKFSGAVESDPVEAPVRVGNRPPTLPEPMADTGPGDRETVHQVLPGASLRLAWKNRLALQLGVQRADYRRQVTIGATGQSSSSEERPWVGSASTSYALGRGRLVYAAYARGFEDSGYAPSSAINAGEVLPASRTEQWDAGLRWPLPGNTSLIASVFRLERPGTALDENGRFGLRGLVRNEGIEVSVVSRPIDGLSIVSGLLLQDPQLLDAPDDVGPLAVDIADYVGILEIDYEPAHWRGIGASVSIECIGPAIAKADNSVDVPGYTTLGFGLRYGFRLGNAPASIRASVSNVTDEFAWGSNDDEGFRWNQQRAFQLVLAADFPLNLLRDACLNVTMQATSPAFWTPDNDQ